MFGLTIIYSADLKKLDDILDEKQRIIHDKIKKERLHHFYSGLGVGSVFGLFILLSDIKMTSKFCLAGLILILTTSIVYYILPKSDYMINHLDTKEKREVWMNVSRNFMKKKMIGFALSIIVYFSIPMFL
jgi:hypothetical protein|tara:strand:- start:663 stop:1052 length:390 start_codon:yes stop_codon:yes gene_type:complete